MINKQGDSMEALIKIGSAEAGDTLDELKSRGLWGAFKSLILLNKLVAGVGLNLRPSGYEPD